MRDQFEIAGGTVAGRDHVAAGRNNQDAFAWHQDERCTIAVVCDGCSEGAHSEVGAQLGARLAVRMLRHAIANPTIPGGEHGEPDIALSLPEDIESVLTAARGGIRSPLSSLAMTACGGQREELLRFVRDHLLATVVGCVIAPWGTVVFSVGDGTYAVNGMLTQIGPFPNNEPPYLAYDLLPTSALRRGMDLQFRVQAFMPTADVQSLLLGTDGVVDLVAAEQRMLPGKDEAVGPLAQFWTDDRYFRNPDMVRRRLTLINREAVGIDHASGTLVRSPGLLPDDTTLVAIRRRKP